MKIKLFTHTDLDGIGCAILGKLTFNDIDIEESPRTLVTSVMS